MQLPVPVIRRVDALTCGANAFGALDDGGLEAGLRARDRNARTHGTAANDDNAFDGAWGDAVELRDARGLGFRGVYLAGQRNAGEIDRILAA